MNIVMLNVNEKLEGTSSLRNRIRAMAQLLPTNSTKTPPPAIAQEISLNLSSGCDLSRCVTEPLGLDFMEFYSFGVLLCGFGRLPEQIPVLSSVTEIEHGFYQFIISEC
jgi:hypothetical protein